MQTMHDKTGASGPAGSGPNSDRHQDDHENGTEGGEDTDAAKRIQAAHLKMIEESAAQVEREIRVAASQQHYHESMASLAANHADTLRGVWMELADIMEAAKQ